MTPILLFNGYGDSSEIPSYRKLVGQVRGFNPVHGWVPLVMTEPEMEKKLSKRPTRQSIAEIESLLEKNGETSFHMPFPPEQRSLLSKAVDFETEFSLFISLTSLVSIIDVVRNTILNWVLKLEEDGVLGEGLSFTKDEKEIVTHHNYNVNNFYSTVANTQIQQASIRSQQHLVQHSLDVEAIMALMAQLRPLLEDLNLGAEQRNELECDIITVESQAKSPKPKQGILKECLTSIRSILEGAGGGAATHILIKVGELLAQI